MVNIVNNHFKIKWPYIAFALLNFSFELLIIFGFSFTIQSTPCDHCTLVKIIVLWNSQWKALKLVSVKINNGGTLTLVDSDILNKKDSELPKIMFWLKKSKFIPYDWFSSIKSNEICTHVCWLLKGVESGNSRIVD